MCQHQLHKPEVVVEGCYQVVARLQEQPNSQFLPHHLHQHLHQRRQ
jgi:hypothetical protein